MTCREFDVIIFGATGYTGEHIAREMHALASKGGAWQGVAWAIGGRSQPKLSAMAAKHGLTPAGVVIADTSDAASLRSMTARAKVVMNATGPYRFYGEAVVEACIATKTDYVDLCGEPEFIDRCLLKHADAAEAAGVLIVHACAFDSVPADIGCLYTALQYPPPALTLTLIPTLTLILTLTLTLTLTRYPPPALCAHADMYHTFDVAADATGAAAHATTFYAAVHGFGGVGATRAQRKAHLLFTIYC